MLTIYCLRSRASKFDHFWESVTKLLPRGTLNTPRKIQAPRYNPDSHIRYKHPGSAWMSSFAFPSRSSVWSSHWVRWNCFLLEEEQSYHTKNNIPSHVPSEVVHLRVVDETKPVEQMSTPTCRCHEFIRLVPLSVYTRKRDIRKRDNS